MTETTTADLALIQAILPHRYPILLIDRVEDIEKGVRATGIKNVTMNEPHLQGHFPGVPIMPGVLIIEACAQTAALLVGVTLDLAGKNALVYFMGIESAKFRRKVVPGDVLKLHVETKRGGGKVWKFACRAEVDGAVACEAEVTAMLDVPKDSA